MKTVLFLCTGNYYRSRFAEELFNGLAERAGLAWRAVSAGLAAYETEYASIAADTVRELARRQIAVASPPRRPRQVRESDLTGADRVIALNEGEHWPMLAEQFPDWVERVEYWHIPDMGEAPAREALGAAERKVRALVRELGKG